MSTEVAQREAEVVAAVGPQAAPQPQAEREPIRKKVRAVMAAVAVGVLVFLLPRPAGLPQTGHAYLALLVSLLILFVTEPLPLPLIMVLSAVALILFGIGDTNEVWASYANPVVFFVLGCLMIAIVAEKVGLVQRLSRFMLRYAGTNVVRCSFVCCMGIGLASAFMHNAAATAVGVMTMVPLVKAAGIKPHSRTGAFLLLSVPFCSSAGGMGTLLGGGRNMVAAAFLKDIAGIELTFLQWMIYAMPAAILAVPAVWLAVYLVFRPDRQLCFPEPTTEQRAKRPFTADERRALWVIALTMLGFFTKSWHGLDYSLIAMLAVVVMVLLGLMDWKLLSERTEWAVPVMVFGGGIALGSAMSSSGAAEYLAGVFFPFFEGRGWLYLVVGVGLFAGVITNLMANVAAAALILPIAFPLAIREGVDPTIIALTLGMWTSFAYLLVIGCPPNVLAYSYGYFRPGQLTKAGLVAAPVGMSIMVLIAVTWWRLVGLV
jgi:sodium-dependent dicarboxylate transporter 2/3/5